MPIKQKAFETGSQKKEAYKQSVKPVEWLYNQQLYKPAPIVIPIKNTKKILAIKSTGGGL